MELYVDYTATGMIDGLYRVFAPGKTQADLYVADENGALDDFTALAHIPLDADGNGRFLLTGSRMCPPRATHLCLRCGEEALIKPIPDGQRTAPLDGGLCLCLMSDLHLAAKPWNIRRALRAGQGCDAVLLAGDVTNDGLQEQFDQLRELIAQELPDTPVLPVCGNHDYPLHPMPYIGEEPDAYVAFQRDMLARTASMGLEIEQHDSGAYAARIGKLTIFGLNAATPLRRLTFKGGQQLTWLKSRMAQAGDGWKLVMCHTPLRLHQPVRGKTQPYAGGDGELQRIVDAARNVIFHSGHLHFTLNEGVGCVDCDDRQGNLYINDSSVCPPCFRQRETLEDPEWIEGAAVLLRVAGDEVEVVGKTLRSGKYVARAYYRFKQAE